MNSDTKSDISGTAVCSDMDKAFSDSDDEVILPRPKQRGRKPLDKSKKPAEKKSYRCDRCNFSSSSKAKYTKHAKSAHSGTIVQCDHCEFKTPYKWNLDRHYKNHLGGGILCCHICNFSCDIKQSLTVHLQNHHTNVPEEIIESVKRQQVPSRNSHSVNNNSQANNNNVNNGSVKDISEKKVPPLRISRSLTGLSLGEDGVKDESVDLSTAPIKDIVPNVASGGEKKTIKRCDHCDFTAGGTGSANVLKKHLANQHGIRAVPTKAKELKSRATSSSPEYGGNKSIPSPSLCVPIALPPKKSKGTISPKMGASASTTNSPFHRSHSPLKASEASAFGDGDHSSSEIVNILHSAASSMIPSAVDHGILNLAQIHTGKESAFTPVNDYSHSQFSSLKKPKQRALASFYEKINQKLSSSKTEESVPTPLPLPEDTGAQEDTIKNFVPLTASSKSNRCQHCRQRCKSSADLAAHLAKCTDAIKKSDNESEKAGVMVAEKEDVKDIKPICPEDTFQVPCKPLCAADNVSPWNLPTSSAPMEVEESDDSGDFDSKAQLLNGSTDGDDLIGFETAPGVGAIHTGKMDEMEYQGYHGEPIFSKPPAEESDTAFTSHKMSEEDEDEEEETNKGKTKSMITTRKVYRCPEADCSFWATTASRFHVHIVGHYNLKPFECSECHYKSNWRWDVNKHIRLKTPKDPKHAKAKTLLTHESGQRDYRKYDNYLVTMALTHSANAKAPDCSTVASKRTKNSVATPKSSPELVSKESNVCTTSPSSTSGKQKMPKLTKAPASSSSSASSTVSVAPEEKEHTPFTQPLHDDPYSTELVSSPAAGNKGEGRSFVETRMLAGGEIYQTSLLKQEIGMMITNEERDQEEVENDTPPQGFDLSLKRPRPHEDDAKNQGIMIQSNMPKKSRLQEPISVTANGGATNEGKIVSMWQCIKCSFKHMNKDIVTIHIREQHKPKKGDSVSILSHNHLIQVSIPEQDMDALMGDGIDYSRATQRKEMYQQMYNENGKVLSCKFCPFTTILLYEMEIHADHHFTKSDSYFSCPHCSYSVAVKSELQEHMKFHGEVISQPQLEIQNKLINSTMSSDSKHSPSSTSEPVKKNKYVCNECPYSTNHLGQYQYHKHCHEPRDYPFKCHRCTFNASVKLHLLQHLQVHGIQIDEAGVTQEKRKDEESHQQAEDEPLNLCIFADRKPIVVWDSNGIPMEGYRCQVCPQVFNDLCDLREHEFVNNHTKSSRQCDSPPCEAVNLTTKPKKSSQKTSKGNSSGKRSVHSTSIGSSGGGATPLLSPASLRDGSPPPPKGERESLFLCDECPARFFFEKELKIHHTFHENKSIFQCPKCSYSARQKDPHLMSHMRVHGAAYQEKTKALMSRFPKGKATQPTPAPIALTTSLLNSSIFNPAFFQTSSAALALTTTGALNPKFKTGYEQFIPSSDGNVDGMKKNGVSIVCPKCPEKFYTPASYQMHITYHGKVTDYRCRFCDYCADSRKALAVHELVHAAPEGSIEAKAAAELVSKLPPSNPFNPISMMAMVAHHDTPFGAMPGASGDLEEKNCGPVPDEAYEGNPDFVYPTYMKNGRVKSKRYKCLKCPSAFEKKDQYHTHIGLHGSNQKYKCTVCDYSVTYYANYIQHLKKHESQSSEMLLPKYGKKGLEDEGTGSYLKFGDYSDASPNGSVHSNGSSVDESQELGPHNLLKCPFCPYHSFEDATLESHIVHHQENPNWLHVCDMCNFRTSSKKSLKEHGRLHSLNTFRQLKSNGVHKAKNGVGRKASSFHLNGKSDEHQQGLRHENEDSSNESL